ncbi:phosphotransferase [Trujillonella endophytica]|uniref:Phosphotransferase enzyme family protein n=1 Tax=Trujillonella endophytica TaxID=673521 RepID=A0A1H8VCN2_9ACTN|nr:phosphotransferase [Trujillella endophytica]SEP13139.1 Phosphotransferase enzyme family protein [Trujillella endophytica]
MPTLPSAFPTGDAPAALPGGTTPAELLAALRRRTGRPDLRIEALECSPLPHRISAPTTRALTRVRVRARDGEGPTTIRLVAKELQAARHGLPPQMPPAERERLDAVIPWRLEADVLASGVAGLMPPGMRAPDVVATTGDDEDRLTLWLADVDALDTPWTAEDTVRAATSLGRLAARRAGTPAPLLPGGDFLDGYLRDQLGAWAVPWLLDDATWAHPAFLLPEVAGLRAEVCALARDVARIHARLDGLPVLPAHGDATPMNLLRPRSAPGELVLIDWGMATPAPVGYDLLPLVFGRAEAGLASPAELPRLLDLALTAYRSGLAAEGLEVPAGVLATAVLAAIALRYPCTTMPLPALVEPVGDAALARAAERGGFVRAVLDLLAARAPELAHRASGGLLH